MGTCVTATEPVVTELPDRSSNHIERGAVEKIQAGSAPDPAVQTATGPAATAQFRADANIALLEGAKCVVKIDTASGGTFWLRPEDWTGAEQTRPKRSDVPLCTESGEHIVAGFGQRTTLRRATILSSVLTLVAMSKDQLLKATHSDDLSAYLGPSPDPSQEDEVLGL